MINSHINKANQNEKTIRLHTVKINCSFEFSTSGFVATVSSSCFVSYSYILRAYEYVFGSAGTLVCLSLYIYDF